MNKMLRRSMLSVAGLVFAGGSVMGPAIAAHASPSDSRPMAAVAQVSKDDRKSDSKSDRKNDRKDDRRGDRGDRGDDRRDGRQGKDERKRERMLGIQYQAQPNFFYCGPAATRIALSAQGHTPTQDEVARKLGTTEAGTNSAEDITRVLNEVTGGKHYRTTEIRDAVAKPEQVQRLRADVVAALDAGRPVVANIKGTTVDTDGRAHSYEGGHYLTVVGQRDDAGIVKISDPADPVGEYWVTAESLANWIAERGYSS